MDLRKAFKEIFKCYITQNMLRFENIDLSLIKPNLRPLMCGTFRPLAVRPVHEREV